MTDKIKGPVLSDTQITAINGLKNVESAVLESIALLEDSDFLHLDPRWIATGKTDIEKGFMSLVKGVSKGSSIAK